MKIRLSDVLPSNRDNFLLMMKIRGVEGKPVKGGTAGSLDRIISELEGNLQFATTVLDRRHASVRVSDDPFVAAANEAISKRNERYKSVRKLSLMTDRREYDYHTLQQACSQDRHYTRPASSDSGKVQRKIFGCMQNNLITIDALADEGSAKAWFSANSNEVIGRGTARTIVYVHGVLIEGIHFNVEKAPKLNGAFTELTPADSTPTKPFKIPKIQTNEFTISRHGYVTVGNFVFTTFMGHVDWLNAQPLTPVTDEVLVERWRGAITKNIVAERTKAETRLEKLNKALIEEELKIGRLQLLEKSAKDNTNSAIQSNIDQLRTIPELESFTPTKFGFTVITKTMLATRQRTGEERYCGKFEIQVNISGAVRARNIASPTPGYRNPHNNCVGTFSRVFGSALRTFDYYSLILAVMEYYRMVDESYDHKFGLLPDRKTAPSTTYVSSWQAIAGEWSDGNNSLHEVEETILTAMNAHTNDPLVDGDDDSDDDEDED
jgi:hypothetical protein